MQVKSQISGPLGQLLSAGIGAAVGQFSTASTYGTNVGSEQTRMLYAQEAEFRSFAGGGYTGSGARSGGVDGQGGFPAILHPNETVVDHSQGQGGGLTVVMNVSTGVQQTVRAEIANMMPQIANATKQAVASARMRGGSFSAAMGA